ncbi:MAG: DUF6427 family protein [Bacteroidales bacterium]
MPATIFKSNHSFVIIFILIIGTALWGFSLLEPPMLSLGAITEMPLYTYIFELLSNNRILFVIISFAIVLTQGFLLIGFNKKHILISNRTFLPAFFYIFITGSIVLTQTFSPVLLGGFFIFYSIDFMFRTYRIDYALNEIYMSGFFIAIASLFWAPFIYFIILLFISLIIMRTFILREWIIALLGFLTPLFFMFVIYYVFIPEQNSLELLYFIISELTVPENIIHLNISYYVFFSFLILLIIVASIKVIGNYQSKKIKTRKYFEINWWYFFVAILLFAFLKRSSLEMVYLVALPVSFLLTEFFYSVRSKTILNIILFLLFCCSLFIQIKAHL